MIGKVWTLITVTLFFSHFHHIESDCLEQSISELMTENLMEGHVFKMKKFPPQTERSELLSIINIVCSYWTENKNKKKTYPILETFETIMVYLDKNLHDYCNIRDCIDDPQVEKNITILCATHNCTDAYSLDYVEKGKFCQLYLNSCQGYISDLKCPSKNTTSLTTTSSTSTALDGSKTLTTASPNITAPENQSFLSTVSSPTENTANEKIIAENQSLSTTVKTCSALLAVSLLLNIFLLWLNCWQSRKSLHAEQGTAIEMMHLH